MSLLDIEPLYRMSGNGQITTSTHPSPAWQTNRFEEFSRRGASTTGQSTREAFKALYWPSTCLEQNTFKDVDDRYGRFCPLSSTPDMDHTLSLDGISIRCLSNTRRRSDNLADFTSASHLREQPRRSPPSVHPNILAPYNWSAGWKLDVIDKDTYRNLGIAPLGVARRATHQTGQQTRMKNI